MKSSEDRKRICSQCKKKKPLSAFWKDITKKDGKKYCCKDCYSQPFNKKKAKQRSEKLLEKRKGNFWAKYRKRHLKKIKARDLANDYFRRMRAVCSVEGCKEIGEKHHHDYNKPLDIIWLCRKHHLLLEQKGE